MTAQIAWIVLWGGFITSALFLFIGRPILRRLDAVDVPTARSSHVVVTLRGGGIAPLAGVLVALAYFTVSPGDEGELFVIIGMASIGMAVVGLVEDIRGLRIPTRVCFQLLVGIAGSWALVIRTENLWWWALPLAVAAAAFVNVANFMDGIDAISCLHGVVMGAALTLCGLAIHSPGLSFSGLLIALLFVAFLPWNLLGGRVFLGDVGSYLLGGLVVFASIAALLEGVPFLAAFGATAIYWADTGATLFRRFLSGEKWYEPHRTHVYQRLTDAGLSHIRAASVVALFSVFCFLAGATTFGQGWWRTPLAAALTALLVSTYLLIPRILRLRSRPARAATRLDDSLKRLSSVNDAVLPANKLATVAVRATNDQNHWVVIGGSGFVGHAIVEKLRSSGIAVETVAAPRLVGASGWTERDVLEQLARYSEESEALRGRLRGASVVINAAGLASPDGHDQSELIGANAVLPVVIAEASMAVGARRFIHVSSAAVQGRRPLLDESMDFSPFSPYSRSKALGERSIARLLESSAVSESGRIVILRATSVQGPGRRTTESLQKVASTPISSVAKPGDQPTPVVSVSALAHFTQMVGEHRGSVPLVVLQPWEGMTTSSVLRTAGGRNPTALNPSICRFVVGAGYALSGILQGRLDGSVRRIELMWFGQRQIEGWAVRSGYIPNPDIAAVLRPENTVGVATVSEGRDRA